MGWYLFYVGNKFYSCDTNGIVTTHQAGEMGVGRCTRKAGIQDMKNGTLFVIDNEYMEHYCKTRILAKRRKSLKPEDIKKAIELYYDPVNTKE